MRLLAEGHDVRVSVSEPKAVGTMRGLVPRTEDWRAELEWVRGAGPGGVILFEAVSEGFGAFQDELRADGFHVVGGSAFGDRLENDRGFGQALLGTCGFPISHSREFTDANSADHFIRSNPRRYVLKFSDAGETATTYLGQIDDGSDVRAILAQRERDDEPMRIILMDHIDGIEVGVGAYFNGTRFLRPACVDWEHKRFFPGDMGELTGEMGTVATYDGTAALFDRTLGKIEPLLAGRNHVGYVNLNTIINDAGIWPLEFTCRFGYPGFAVLGSLQRTSWSDLFARMVEGAGDPIAVERGFCTGVVLTTPPFPYSRKQVDAAIGLPVVERGSWTDAERAKVYWGEVGLADDQLVTAGLYGWTAVVTGTAATVEASRLEAYRMCERLTVPNARYRHDIGARVPAHIEHLTALGLFEPAQ